jgi:hypothetical protein
MVHIGSWGTPDFGLTEKVGDFFGLSRNTSGGSQLKGDYTPTTEGFKGKEIAYEPNDFGGFYYDPGTNETGGTTQTTQPQPTQDSGQVLGTNTQGGTSPPDTGGSSGPSVEQQLMERRRNLFNDKYDIFKQTLDEQAGLNEQRYNQWRNSVKNMHNTQREILQLQKQRNEMYEKEQRGEIRTEQKSALKRLSEDMRNALRAGQMKLGAMGAGSSSAVPMFSFALAKEANKRRGNVMAQSRELMNDLRQKKMQLNNVASQNLQKLDLWKTEKMNEVENWYHQARSSIAKQKGMAQSAKKDYEIQLLSDAMSRLNQLDQQAQAYKQNLADWVGSRAAQIQDIAMEMGKMRTNVNPQQVYEPLRVALAPNQSGENFNPYNYNPMQKKKEKFEDYISNFLN